MSAASAAEEAVRAVLAQVSSRVDAGPAGSTVPMAAKLVPSLG